LQETTDKKNAQRSFFRILLGGTASLVSVLLHRKDDFLSQAISEFHGYGRPRSTSRGACNARPRADASSVRSVWRLCEIARRSSGSRTREVELDNRGSGVISVNGSCCPNSFIPGFRFLVRCFYRRGAYASARFVPLGLDSKFRALSWRRIEAAIDDGAKVTNCDFRKKGMGWGEATKKFLQGWFFEISKWNFKLLLTPSPTAPRRDQIRCE
jgi:hypothetical protein